MLVDGRFIDWGKEDFLFLAESLRKLKAKFPDIKYGDEVATPAAKLFLEDAAKFLEWYAENEA